MSICNEHNLSRPISEKSFGIRLSLPQGDTLGHLLGQDWEAFHWYATAGERDKALAEIRAKHSYSRPGDFPTYVYEKITRD
jgi:hypothetical protein